MKTNKHDAYENGKQTRRDKKPLTACPYTIKSRLGAAWRAGWYWTDLKMWQAKDDIILNNQTKGVN